MQIDCEVVNTSLLRIREKIIPENLRTTIKVNDDNSSSNTNSTTSGDTLSNKSNAGDLNIKEKFYNINNVTIKPAKVTENNNIVKTYKPYFVDKNINNIAQESFN